MIRTCAVNTFFAGLNATLAATIAPTTVDTVITRTAAIISGIVALYSLKRIIENRVLHELRQQMTALEKRFEQCRADHCRPGGSVRT